MPETVRSTPPEKLRLLRLRSALETATTELDEAMLEVKVSDAFTIAVLTAKSETKRALANVVSSLQAFEEAESEVVE